MNVLVTGASGFIGTRAVSELLSRGVNVIATSELPLSELSVPWKNKVMYIQHDLFSDSPDFFENAEKPDCCLHLAWAGIPRYTGFHHLKNILPQFSFLNSLVSSGLCNLTVAGTCLEYGLFEGCLSEETPCHPVTPYALAKTSLRQALEILQKSHPFCLKWPRLFYIYDETRPGSILYQLKQAVIENRTEFLMSPGDQIRDFIHVTDAVKQLVNLTLSTDINGIFNICSGKPLTVEAFVRSYLDQLGKDIHLNKGAFPYPDYEPFAFWGSREKFDQCIEN